MQAAFDRLEVREFTAEAISNNRPLGPPHSVSDGAIEELIQVFTPRTGAAK